MYTISRVGKIFGLSRSTLLYYERKGLLSPALRSGANYRLYADADLKRLEKIKQYRQAGIPLAQIAELLAQTPCQSVDILQQRLSQLNSEIVELRRQQQVIVDLLQTDALIKATRIMTKQRWVELLRATGMDDHQMRLWHKTFEASAPLAHQDFLESLGIDSKEIAVIREWSK